MKDSTRIPYYRSIELATLPDSEKEEYNKKYLSLRRKMRSLIAHQEVRDDKPNMMTYISKSNLRDFRYIANAKIMEAFIGKQRYMEEVLEYYDSRKSPIDNFDLYTMYHFYRFKEKIMKEASNTIINSRTLNPEKPINFDFNSVLAKAEKEYFSKSDINNMFVNRGWFKFINSPIKSYKTITKRQEDKLKEYQKNYSDKPNEEALDIAQIPCEYEIKADVLYYMLSKVEKNIGPYEADRLRLAYTGTFAKNFENLSMSKYAIEYLKDLYNFSGNIDEIIEELSKTKENSTIPADVEYNCLDKENTPKEPVQYTVFEND